MKNVIIASLLLSAATTHVIAQVSSPDPECEFCNDASFLFAAQDALNDCPGQLRILQSRLDTAANDQAVDLAWNYFCTGTCPTNVAKIDDDHACCMAEHGPMAMNIRHGCSRSSSGRYCGAEMSNLKKVQCFANTTETCTAKANCQWDAEANQCYFNGDAATVAGVCSDCNRNYFTNFFAGGIFTPQEHAVAAAAYATMCTPLNGTSCYSVAAGIGFRLPDALGSTDVSNRICPNTPNARLAKMCMRSNGARVGEGVRRAAINGWMACPADTDNGQCRADLDAGFQRAAAIDASGRRVCVTDDTGSVCLARVVNAFSTVAGQCMEKTLVNGTCEGSCPTTSRNAINSLGCCADFYGFNGFADARTSLSTVATSQFSLGLANFNRTAESLRNPNDGNGRVAISNSDYRSMRDNAAARVSGNDGLSPVRSCGNVGAGSADAQCPAGDSIGRTYEFELALRFSVFGSHPQRDYLNAAFAVDVASAIGVSYSQISSVTARASTLKVRINAVDYPATIMTVTVAGDSNDDNQASDDAVVALNKGKGMIFPTFGPEVALNCEGAFRYAYNSFFKGAYAISKSGESPLSESASTDAQTRNEGSGEATKANNGVGHTGVMVGLVAAFMSALMVVA